MASPKFKTYAPKAGTNQPKQIESWSFTRYNDWSRCPFYAKCKHLLKLPEPKSPQMQRGADVAKASEDYLLKKTTKLAKELQTFKDHYKFYRSQKTLVAEENWGFTATWEPTAWNNWAECKLRAKIDIGYQWDEDNSFNIRDGKTGKFDVRKNDDYMLQLELYAAVAIAQYPESSLITVQLLYTDLGVTFPEEDPMTYTAKQAMALQKTWDKRIKPMFADRTFAPRPGRYCSWCPYSKSKGGPCKF